MPLSGFPELLPSQRFVELTVLDRLRETFELHGFAPVETPAVEALDQLLRKGEIEKEVYVLRRLHADADERERAGDNAGLGLHFDLTVPFARYVLEHAGHLEFPFRRYQIQKAWRGERPQEGRFREFTQADIDIVAKDTLPLHHDVEIARVMAEALAGWSSCRRCGCRSTTASLIEGFYRGLGASDPAAVMRIIDKLDKLPADAIEVQLRNEAGLDERQAGLCLQLAEIRSTDTSASSDRVRELGVGDELLDSGLAELAAVIDGCAQVPTERVRVEADLRIARGLDYYTGTVFETRMSGFESTRLDLLRRALRLAGLRRPHDLPGRGHLPRRHPAAGPAAAARGHRRLAGGAVGGAGRPAGRGVPPAVRRDRARAAGAGDRRPRSRPPAQKYGNQIRYARAARASRSSGSRVLRRLRTGTRSRTSAAATRCRPTRIPGCRRTATCDRR